MPRRKSEEKPAQQAERFKRAVQDLIDAGELNPTEADRLFEIGLGGVARLRQQWFDGEEDSENPS